MLRKSLKNIVKVSQKQQHIAVKGIGGQQGKQGPAGPQGSQGPQGPQGPAGPAGADGFSPTASVTQTPSGTTISITDKNGTTSETIPPINDGSLTIQKNGTNVATFAANSSSNIIANITVPTTTSELTNNSGFVTTSDVSSAVESEASLRQDADDNLQGQIDTINSKIPNQASSVNQLADKSFVNSSVQTATANFRGNWDNWTDIPTDSSQYPADYAGSTIPTTNDYLVVQDASDYTLETLEGTWRFKYSGTWSTNGKIGWHPEYQVNETPLTSDQLAALNSGATSALINQITTNKNDISSLNTAMAGKQDTLTAGDNININASNVISFDGGAETVSNTAPSSSLTLSNVLQGTLKEMTVYGDATQQTYTGKNLIGFSNIAPGTGNGVNYTLSNTKVVANGTTTGNENIILRTSTKITLPAGTYTASFRKTSGSYSSGGGDAAFYFRPQSGSAFVALTMRSFNSSGFSQTTFTLSSSAEIYIELYANSAGQVFNNFEFTAQIESGSTATSYEPYVGGMPSPNPDYPQAVQTVTGRQVVAVTGGDSESAEYEINLGKNLLAGENISNTVSGITLTLNNGVLTANGTFTTGGNSLFVPINVTLPAGTYCLSHNVTQDSSVSYYIKLYDGTNGYDGVFTLEEETTMTQLRGWANPTTFTNYVDHIQLERGVEKTEWAPYFEPIELCKIGDYQDYIYRDGEDWYLHKEIGVATDSSGSTSITISEMVSNGDFYSYYGGTISGKTITYNSAISGKNAVYYQLDIATDDQITNATLISQLEAISLFTGTNTITVNSVNQPALLLLTSYANTINGKLAKLLAEQ